MMYFQEDSKQTWLQHKKHYVRRVGNSDRKRFNSNKSNNNYKKIEILPLQNKRPNGK